MFHREIQRNAWSYTEWDLVMLHSLTPYFPEKINGIRPSVDLRAYLCVSP